MFSEEELIKRLNDKNLEVVKANCNQKSDIQIIGKDSESALNSFIKYCDYIDNHIVFMECNYRMNIDLYNFCNIDKEELKVKISKYMVKNQIDDLSLADFLNDKCINIMNEVRESFIDNSPRICERISLYLLNHDKLISVSFVNTPVYELITDKTLNKIISFCVKDR